MPTAPEIRTIPTASGHKSASVHLHIKTNITTSPNSHPTQGVKHINIGTVLANEEIAAIPSIATNVPSTLVIFIPMYKHIAEKNVPIANPDIIAVNNLPEGGLALRGVVALPDREARN